MIVNALAVLIHDSRPQPHWLLQAHLKDQGQADEGSDLWHSAMRQKDEYERRGISLTYFDGERKDPHLVGLDRDPFRNKRLMYFVKKGQFHQLLSARYLDIQSPS